MLQLRPYQEECRDMMLSDMQAGEKSIGVLPTGSGKALVIASLIDETVKADPDSHIFNIIHSQELVAQNRLEFINFCPEHKEKTGIYSAGLGYKEMRQITFAGIQSLYKKFKNIDKCDLIIVDESHTIPHKDKVESKTWRSLFEDVAIRFPKAKICGLTATDYRLDGGYLTEGENAFFTKKSYEYGLMEAIKDGYLCKLLSFKTKFQIDTDGLRKTGGDFNQADIEKRMEGANTDNAVAELVTIGLEQERKKWLVFGCGVNNCNDIAKQLTKLDIPCAVITGDTEGSERADRIEQFKNGNLRALVNHGVLTTGFNAPAIDMVAMLRPTLSTSLWVQVIGRGSRLHPDKTRGCLILDFAGNTERHGYLDTLRIKKPEKKEDKNTQAPVKVCPECHIFVPPAVQFCPECDYEFPGKEKPELEIEKERTLFSEEADLEPPFGGMVTSYDFRLHQKQGMPQTLCVRFFCRTKTGDRNFNNYFSFDHGKKRKAEASDMFLKIFGKTAYTVSEADALLRGSLAVVNPRLKLQKNTQGFINIVSVLDKKWKPL